MPVLADQRACSLIDIAYHDRKLRGVHLKEERHTSMVCWCSSIDGQDLIQNIREEENARGPTNRQDQLQCKADQNSAQACCVLIHQTSQAKPTQNGTSALAATSAVLNSQMPLTGIEWASCGRRSVVVQSKWHVPTFESLYHSAAASTLRSGSSPSLAFGTGRAVSEVLPSMILSR